MTFLTSAQLATARRLLELALGSYQDIRQEYADNIKGAMAGYLLLGVRVNVARNDMIRAMSTAFVDAFEQGFTDGGGKLPMDPDASDWLAARQAAEQGFITILFQGMAGLKADGDQEAMVKFATDRSVGYLATLDGVYNEGKLRAMTGNKMLTFGGEDGLPDNVCQRTGGTCVQLMGQRHRASWWVANGLIPGQPGNPRYTCHGYSCRHFLYDDSGNVVTI